MVQTRLALTATPGRPYAAFVAKAVAIIVVTVSKRYTLLGSDDQKFELLGSDNRNLPLLGSDDQNFPLSGQ